MDWSYVAGLFDGEGSISFTKTKATVVLRINISASYEPTREALRSFLASRGISTGSYTSKNPHGQSHWLSIHTWEGCRKFCHAVYPYLIEKKRHVEIAFRAFQLRTKIATNDEMFFSHMAEFDALRHELHALANKGKPLTVKWV
jgi:hypothetical protein